MTARSFTPVLLVYACLSLTANPCAILAGDALHPIAAGVKAELKDPAKPFTLLVAVAVKEGTADKFEAAFAKALPPSLKDKGCLVYVLYREVGAPNRYLVRERWENFHCLTAHLNTEHIRTLLDTVREDLATAPNIKVLVGGE